MKLHPISLGCQMSVADGEEMSRPFAERGLSVTGDLSEADAVIVNTCTVRQHAEDRAVSLIGRLKGWKEQRPGRLVIVTGCAAERISGWLRKRFPHIDLIAGARSVEDYPKLLEGLLGGRLDGAAASARPRTPVSSFVTIQRGCNYSCAYCVVPSVRGREVYRPMEDVLAEVRARADEGAREAVLLGQTVNSYKDPSRGADFADLLRAVERVEGIERIRFTSPHPFYLDDRLAGAMAECGKTARHLHLPAQSGSDRMLRAMRRNYTRGSYLKKIGDARRRIPDLALTTDLIVGFPGETEEDFEATLSFLREGDFCAAYCAKYSPREGTPAWSLGDPVSKQVKEERLARLLGTVESVSRRHLEALDGRRVRVLLESPTDGRTQYHFKARLDRPLERGTVAEAEVVGCTKTALRCRPARIACA